MATTSAGQTCGAPRRQQRRPCRPLAELQAVGRAAWVAAEGRLLPSNVPPPEFVEAPAGELGLLGLDPADFAACRGTDVVEAPDDQAAAVVLDRLGLVDERAALGEIRLAERGIDKLAEARIMEVGAVVGRSRRIV